MISDKLHNDFIHTISVFPWLDRFAFLKIQVYLLGPLGFHLAVRSRNNQQWLLHITIICSGTFFFWRGKGLQTITIQTWKNI